MSERPSAVVPLVAGIGNTLMAVPMLRQLGRAMDVTAWCGSRAIGQAVERLPEFKHIHVGIKPNLLRIARQRFDWCVMPFPSNRWQYSVLATMTRARHVAMHGYPVGRWSALHGLAARRVPAVLGLHDVIQNLRLLELLDLRPDETDSPTFNVTIDDAIAADGLLLGTHPTMNVAGGYVVIHAGSAKTILAQSKRWPPKNFASVSARLLANGVPVLLIEGPDEAGVAAEINAHAASPLPVVKLSGHLGVAAEILRRAWLYVGSDSGLAHLAAAVGTPPVTLFGPADPNRVCPFGHRNLVVTAGQSTFLYPWLATRPKLPPGDDGHVKHILVEPVLRTLNAALQLPR